MPPGCWPVVRLMPTQPGASRLILRRGGVDAPLLQVFLGVAESGLLRHRAHGARPEHMALPEELKGIPVGSGLILAGKVQVDIRHLFAAEAQEGLEGDIKAVL